MERYDVIRKVGSGSFGKVYLVREIANPKEDWVLKQVPLPRLEEDREKCLREVRVAAGLHHPCLNSLKESFVDGRRETPRLCMVLPFCNSGSLDDIIKKHQERRDRVPESCILDWFAQLVLGLEHLHFNKILHRDLKPENVFLTSDKLVGCDTPVAAQLGDFGLSRILETTNAMANTLCGTPYSMSPEIFRNKPYNHKSDVWALGCVMYEVMALHPPFQAQNIMELSQKVKHQQLQPLPHCYSLELRALIGQMLQKDVRNRPSVLQLISTPLLASRCSVILRTCASRIRTTNASALGQPPKTAPAPSESSRLGGWGRKMLFESPTAIEARLPTPSTPAQHKANQLGALRNQAERASLNLNPRTGDQLKRSQTAPSNQASAVNHLPNVRALQSGIPSGRGGMRTRQPWANNGNPGPDAMLQKPYADRTASRAPPSAPLYANPRRNPGEQNPTSALPNGLVFSIHKLQEECVQNPADLNKSAGKLWLSRYGKVQG